jgi:hypothetical protein
LEVGLIMNADDASGGGFSGPPPEYSTSTRTAIRYLPVSLHGDVIGYLWGSVSDDAASYLRRHGAQETAEGFQSAVFWSKRLDEACAQGLTPLQAIRRWVGAPEDPRGGTIVSGAVEREAANPRELAESVNPGKVDPRDYDDEAGGTWPDGTPFDRSKGWENLSPFTLEKPGYSFLTESAVRYVPVTNAGEVLGYLWAAVDDDAADFVPRLPAEERGNLAMGPWISRLDQAKQEGLTPIEALRRWIGEPEDARAGGIAGDAEIREASSLEALKEIARQ